MNMLSVAFQKKKPRRSQPPTGIATPYRDDKSTEKELIIPRAQRLDGFTQHDLLTRAADYFAQARKPRAEWKKLEDLNAQLAEFELRCTVDDYDAAARILIEFDGEYLLLWGHYQLMIELQEELQGYIKDKTLARVSAGNLSTAYAQIGQVKTSIKFYRQVLELARKDNNKQNESAALGNLGNVYRIWVRCARRLTITRKR